MGCFSAHLHLRLEEEYEAVWWFGKEVVAAEAPREYGWNGFDVSIICPDDFRKQVIEVLETMKSGIFPVDKNYFSRCRKEFQLSYEGK